MDELVDKVTGLIKVKDISIDCGTNLSLLIPDTEKVLWFGSYESGKLAVYKAEQIGKELPNSLALVAVYIPRDFESFTYYVIFKGTDQLKAKIDQLLAGVIPEYTNWIMEQRNQEIANGNAITLH